MKTPIKIAVTVLLAVAVFVALMTESYLVVAVMSIAIAFLWLRRAEKDLDAVAQEIKAANLDPATIDPAAVKKYRKQHPGASIAEAVKAIAAQR